MNLRRLIVGFVLGSILVLFLVGSLFLWLSRPFDDNMGDINVLHPQYLIAHAGGGLNGKRYTNSRAALINSLEKGFRYVELDLCQLPDGRVFCSHAATLEDTLSVMSLEEAINIWKKEDFVLVTDRLSDTNTLNRYFATRREKLLVESSSIRDYCQLEQDKYSVMLAISEDLRGLMKYIITSIASGQKVHRIVISSHVSDRFLRFYKRLDVHVAVHTINDVDFLKKHVGRDVDFVYTDFIEPNL